MTQWVSQNERGSAWTISFIFWLCRSRFRWLVDVLLYPITLYFFLTAGASRRASRHFFENATGRFNWLDHYRQLLCFARSLVDRVVVLSGGAGDFQVNPVGREQLLDVGARGKGVILLGSHLGNFEAAKALLKSQADFDVHIVAYFGGSQKIRRVLDALNPELASMIIDPTDPDAVFSMRDVIEKGGILAILGDRTGIGEKRLPVSFLDEPTHFPAGPYLLASILHCPVYCFFALRVGKRQYDSFVIKLAEQVHLTRGRREEDATLYAQKYADLLAEKARQYPYNWFNFYEFWTERRKDS